MTKTEVDYPMEAVRMAVGEQNTVANAMLVDESVGVHDPVEIWRNLEHEGCLDSRGTAARGVASTGFWLTDRGIEYGEQRGATKGERSLG